jgi:hypothetical protein
MFDKTIKLAGEYPSDWKPPSTISDIQKIFGAHSFFDGRMIGGAKWQYTEQHPDDLIVFNANIIMPEFGKVWFGDLNLTDDYLVLREISECLDSTLYVLWEMDGRFGSEMKPMNELFDKAVWNTSEDNPTKEWYKKKMDKRYKEGDR